jgi:hypothetical protein
MKISVTTQDIAEAIPNGIDSPLVRALQRSTGTTWAVIVGYQHAYEVVSPHRYIALPSEVVDWVAAWKNSSNVTPLEFDLVLESLLK